MNERNQKLIWTFFFSESQQNVRFETFWNLCVYQGLLKHVLFRILVRKMGKFITKYFALEIEIFVILIHLKRMIRFYRETCFWSKQSLLPDLSKKCQNALSKMDGIEIRQKLIKMPKFIAFYQTLVSPNLRSQGRSTLISNYSLKCEKSSFVGVFKLKSD